MTLRWQVRGLVLVPQWGTHQTIHLPAKLPEHEYLRGMEPLGWLHTQPNEGAALAAGDALAHARLAAAHPAVFGGGGGGGGASPIVLTVSFTPGSASLVAPRSAPPPQTILMYVVHDRYDIDSAA